MDEAHKIFKRLLTANNCVLATVSKNGKPEIAFMQFALDDNENILLKTFNDSRKYENISENSFASICIYNKPDYVQMDGTVVELTHENANQAKENLVTKYGEDGYFSDHRLRFIKFIPTWIRVRLTGEYPPRYETIKD